MAYRTATYTVAWHDDSVEFYHRLVNSVSRQFGIRASTLWQPVHDPAFDFHTRYARAHPRRRNGDSVRITVSLHHDRSGWPLEVTSFGVVEWTPPAPPPPPAPAAPPRPPPVEWQLTVMDGAGGVFAGLKVKLRLPGGSESWHTTDARGVIHLTEPAVTSGRVDIIDITDDSGTPALSYSSLASSGLPTGGRHTLTVPNKRRVIDNIMTSAGVRRRSSYGRLTPPYSRMDPDWAYEIAVLHHSGNRGETDPEDIEALHMGPSKGYDDIGYHFMVDDAGTIFEGRYLAFKGSHVERANTGKIGILVMGDFEHGVLDFDDDEPTTAQLSSVKSLLRVLKSSFSATLAKLGGHKDYKPGTDCPGGELYPLIPAMRTDVGLGGP